MTPESGDIVYESIEPFNPDRIGAAAVYCSDGRIGAHCDDFLKTALGLPRYDRLVLPGGAGCLAGYFATYREADALVGQLEFLIEAHALQRIVLIAHEDCAFYTKRLNMASKHLEQKQREDLRKAASRIRGLPHPPVVEAYFAQIAAGRVYFAAVSSAV